MEYMTIQEAAEKWGITSRRIDTSVVFRGTPGGRKEVWKTIGYSGRLLQ